ncbi:MAG: VWA domain-containing protein [Acidobacteria bacterium]|nr:VWA domain-containing protein [Acidobacteriota bacterium]
MQYRRLFAAQFVFVFLVCLPLPSFGQTPPTEKPRPKLKLPDEDPTAAQRPKKTEEDLTLKLDTMLVNVPALVLDRDGKYVPNLTRDHFQIYEDSIKQQIDGFYTMEAPFNVALMLDTSGSTRFKLEDIQRAALAFADQLRQQDQLMVVSFDSKIFVDSEMTGDRRQMRQAILQTRTGQVTRLYDALDLVLTERLHKVEGRKAIVLFTDGVDTASRLATALSTLELVEESNVLVYVVQYDTQGDMQGGVRVMTITPQGRILSDKQLPISNGTEKQYRYGDQFLQEAAERSGARLYKAETITDVNQAFSQIAEELRHQYSLSYYPANEKRDGTYRKIRVIVERPDTAVRARKGYRAASEIQSNPSKPQP